MNKLLTLIIVSMTCHLVYANSRSPAVDPIRYVEYGKRAVKPVDKPTYFDFSESNAKALAKNSQRALLLSGKGGLTQSPVNSFWSLVLLTSMLLLPLVARVALYSAYKNENSEEQPEQNYDRRNKENVNVLPIQERRSLTQSSSSSQDDEVDEVEDDSQDKAA